MTLEEGSARKFKFDDASSYNLVADDFARFTAQFSKPVAGRLVALAELKGSEHVLDVGTGTGIVALQAARTLCPPSGKVTAIDLSPGMLTAARQKACQEGLSDRMEFAQMDAEELDFAAHSADVVVSLYALRHFPRPDVALAEIFRVLRPGGRLVVAVGSGPPRLSFKSVKAGFERVRDVVMGMQKRQLVACEFLDALVRGLLVTSSEPRGDSAADQHPHATDPVALLFREAGFTSIREEWMGHRWVINTADEFWRLQSTFSSYARKGLAQLSLSDRQTIRNRFMEVCSEVMARDGRLIYPTGALLVYGRRESRS